MNNYFVGIFSSLFFVSAGLTIFGGETSVFIQASAQIFAGIFVALALYEKKQYTNSWEQSIMLLLDNKTPEEIIMSKVFFGNTKTIFFKQLDGLTAEVVSRQGPSQFFHLKVLAAVEYVFFQDPETGFYKFIKFRMAMDPDYRDVYYSSYESAINAICEAYGLNLQTLNRMYNAMQYTPEFMLEKLQNQFTNS